MKVTVLDREALNDPDQEKETFALDVLLGLSAEHKSLPTKYFYDAKGSELFAKITDLEEYYLTACESVHSQTFQTCSETFGSGPIRPTCRIRGTRSTKAPWVSTTGNS